MATFQKIHPDLPPFLEQAIECYCDALEEAELEAASAAAK
jgi:hypothetical protein